MEIQTVSSSCVALLLHGGVGGGEEAAELVRSALCIWGFEPWSSMELDLFPAGGDTLIMARPAGVVRVEAAEWLKPYIGE